MSLVKDYCRDYCPYADKEKYPYFKYCKILDILNENEKCPVFLFAKYCKKQITDDK